VNGLQVARLATLAQPGLWRPEGKAHSLSFAHLIHGTLQFLVANLIVKTQVHTGIALERKTILASGCGSMLASLSRLIMLAEALPDTFDGRAIQRQLDLRGLILHQFLFSFL
jgi:hypothetical protein